MSEQADLALSYIKESLVAAPNLWDAASVIHSIMGSGYGGSQAQSP